MLPPQPGVEPPRHRSEPHDDDEVQRGHGDGEQQQTGTSGHPDGRALPDRGGGGQAVHGAAPGDDQSRAQKADARDDLCRHPGWVHLDGARNQHVVKAVLADQQDQCRRGADDGLGTQSRALALDLAFQADQRGQSERHQQLDDLSAALTRAVEEAGIRQHTVHADTLTRCREVRVAVAVARGDYQADVLQQRIQKSRTVLAVADGPGADVHERQCGQEDGDVDVGG